ncbi:hypothetical protein O6H91_15G083400 [Diphasiastrum complanatum]|uniref:Uncharacterized protein n=1 Tax=Diphasiastrum complanatum TaxID=34168 RepID=A0ACC2BK95_DIPCM|nr:hypothetical protein O6H91_15G083400 [Diphasiastrum complanatum]
MQRLIAHKGLGSNADLSEFLSRLLPLCGSLFNKHQHKTMHAWASMISEFNKRGQAKEAINLYYQMRQSNSDPDAYTYVTVLNACARATSLDQGKLIHSHISKSGLQSNLFVGNALVDMYAKCQSLKDARIVFDGLLKRDVVTWNALISGHVQHERAQEALHFFEQMQMEGFKPNDITLLSILKACGSMMALGLGKHIHFQLTEIALDVDVYIGSTLMDMYVKFGCLDEARRVFNRLREHNVVSWTTMIAGNIQHGQNQEAFRLFERMQQEGVKPNRVTYVSMLRLCGNMLALDHGSFFHSHLEKNGVKLDVILGSALVDMYAKCGSLAQAHKIFKSLEDRNVISWNTLIAGYVQHGFDKEALDLYQQMQQEGLQPDQVTFVSILKACGNMGTLDCGKLLHDELKKSNLEIDLYLGTALIDMYAKCGSLTEACKVFSSFSERNVVLWSAMITGFVQNGDGCKALKLFRQMQEEDLKPDKLTYLSIFKACGTVAALYEGELVHAELLESGLELDVSIGNALIDMYAKCGSIYMARRVFEELSDRAVITWTALITGYAHHGHAQEALQLFGQMQHECVIPNEITLVCVLSACRHTGLLNIGYHISHCTSTISVGQAEEGDALIFILWEMVWMRGVLCLICAPLGGIVQIFAGQPQLLRATDSKFDCYDTWFDHDLLHSQDQPWPQIACASEDGGPSAQ